MAGMATVVAAEAESVDTEKTSEGKERRAAKATRCACIFQSMG